MFITVFTEKLVSQDKLNNICTHFRNKDHSILFDKKKIEYTNRMEAITENS